MSSLFVNNIKHTGGTTTQTNTSSGAVLMPNVPFCRFTITGATPAISSIDTVPITLSNARGISSPATNQFTVSQTGIYRWEGSCRISAVGTLNYCWIALKDVTNNRYHNASTINGGTFDTGVIPYKLDAPNSQNNFVTMDFSHIYQLESSNNYSFDVSYSGGSSDWKLVQQQSEFTLILVG